MIAVVVCRRSRKLTESMKPQLFLFPLVTRCTKARFSSLAQWQRFLGGLMIMFAMTASCLAADYRIDSQEKFDELRESRFQPGDVIQFKRGKRFKGMFAPRGAGNKDAPVIIKAYGKGSRPRIDAGGANTAGLKLKNVQWWEVSDLEITNTDGSKKDQGDLFGIYVLIEKKEGVFKHIYIDDCDVHNINGNVAGKRRGGIHVHVKKCKKTWIDDLRITNNRVTRIGGVGIGNDSTCASVEIRPNDEITKNLWRNVYVAGNYIDETGRNNVIARVSKDAIYEYNTLANSSRYDTGHSIFCFNTDGMRIQFNEAYGNVGEEKMDRGGFDADFNCINTYIQYNYSHDNMWFCGIMKRPNRNVVIRYNISQNERKGLYFYGFEDEKAAENVHIYNNTHFTRKGLKAYVFPQNRTPINTRFENNIFYFEGEGLWTKNSKGINTSFDNNLYYNLSLFPGDSNAITSNPLFVRPGKAGTDIDLKTMKDLRGYRLKTRSPAIDRGKSIEMPDGPLDFFGSPIKGKRVNLGAVE